MGKFSVMVGSPNDGRCVHPLMAKRLWLNSFDHKTWVVNAGGSGYHFNNLWAAAMNAGQEGVITHFAMLHADIEPTDDKPRWLDILIEEMEEKKAELVSVAMPIKGQEGVTSCGFGIENSPWQPYRRFTMRELKAKEFPKTFNLMDAAKALGQQNILGDPAKFHLLHNSGMWVADMRKDCWYHEDENGHAVTFFNFPEAIVRLPAGVNEGPKAPGFIAKMDGMADLPPPKKPQWMAIRESEDWFFSRRLAEAGIRNTYITTRAGAFHHGDMAFPNHEAWGEWKNGDENSAIRWREGLEKQEPAKV